MNRNIEHLPKCVADYITTVIKMVRYRPKVRREVKQELIDHFTDALADCESESKKQQVAEEIIANFGDAKLLARLIRRAKKRCLPMWVKAINCTMSILGIIFIFFIAYSVWVNYTWKNSKVDYIEILNQLNRQEALETNNAWPFYAKAVDLYIEHPTNFDAVKDLILSEPNNTTWLIRFEECNEIQIAKVRDWLESHDAAWGQVTTATELPRYWQKMPDYSSFDKLSSKYLKPIRDLAKMGGWRAIQYAENQQIDQALQDSLRIQRMAKHLLSSKILLEYLVGLSILSSGDSAILEILDKYSPDDKFLKHTRVELEKIYNPDIPFYDFHGESLYIMAMAKDNYNYLLEELPILYIMPMGFLYGGSLQNTEKKVISHYEQIDQRNPYERHTNPIQRTFKEKTPSNMLQILTPALDRVIDLTFMYNAKHQATSTVLALQIYKLDKGTYPDNLEILVSNGYLKHLPVDPYSNGLLKYKRQDDNFILYSLGADFDDDGGKENSEDPWGSEETGGDRVFWPVK